MIKTLKQVLSSDRESFRIPRSVQDIREFAHLHIESRLTLRQIVGCTYSRKYPVADTDMRLLRRNTLNR